MFRTKKDEKLRLDLVKQAGFTLDEVPLVYAFIKGADEALSELQEFRQWKMYKEKQKVGYNLQAFSTSNEITNTG